MEKAQLLLESPPVTAVEVNAIEAVKLAGVSADYVDHDNVGLRQQRFNELHQRVGNSLELVQQFDQAGNDHMLKNERRFIAVYRLEIAALGAIATGLHEELRVPEQKPRATDKPLRVYGGGEHAPRLIREYVNADGREVIEYGYKADYF